MIPGTIQDIYEAIGYVSGDTIESALIRNGIRPDVEAGGEPAYSADIVNMLLDAGYGHPSQQTLFTLKELASGLNMTEEYINKVLEADQIAPVWIRGEDKLYGQSAISALTKWGRQFELCNVFYTAEEICNECQITLADLEKESIRPQWTESNIISESAVYTNIQYTELIRKYGGVMDRLFTLKQLQDKFGLTTDTIRGVARRTGILPKGRIGRANLYGEDMVAELEARFKNHEISADMLSVKEVMKNTGWSRSEVKRRCKLYEVTPVYLSGKAYYTRSMINKMNNEERRLITIREFADGNRRSETELRIYMMKHDAHHVSLNGATYYSRADLENAYHSEEIRTILGTKTKITAFDAREYIKNLKIGTNDNLEDVIEKGFNYIEAHGKPEARRLLKYYILDDIPRIRARRDPVTEVKTCLKYSIRLIDELNADIHMITTEDIADYLSGQSYKYLHFCRNFFRYASMHGKCSFGLIEMVVTQTPGKKTVKPYTDDEWFALQEFLVDTDRHFEKARLDEKYCYAWLYMLIHCFCALRVSDVVDFPMAGDYVVNTNEDISCELITRVVEETIRNLQTKFARKTYAQIFPASPPAYLREAFVTALLLCGMHARANNRTNLFPKHYGRLYIKGTQEFFRGTVMEGFSFRSSRANHSLMTKVHRIGLKHGASVYSVYGLISKMRAHLHEPGYEAETTVQYIAATEGDRDINKTILGLMARGCFGYVYETLLYVLSGSGASDLSPEAVTRGIGLLRNTFTPIELEAVTGQLLSVKDERDKVIGQLIELPHDVLTKMAEDIAADRRVCKVPGVYCACPYECPYQTAIGGVGCKYAVMTADAAHKLNDATIDHIARLYAAENKNVFRKEERQVAALLGTCADFIKTFRACGQDYIEHYIDITVIKQKLVALTERKELINEQSTSDNKPI